MSKALQARFAPWLAVVRRELTAHRLFVPAGFVLGLFAPVAMLSAPSLGFDGDGLHEITALVCALIYGGLAFMILGYSSLAPDVADGRLAFYLARPISAGQLWLGRLFARLATASAAAAAVLIPSLLIGGRPWKAMEIIYQPSDFRWTIFRRAWHWWGGSQFGGIPAHQEVIPGWPPTLLQLFVAALLLFALAHFAGVMLRQRGPWTLFDLAAAGVLWTFFGPSLVAYSELGAMRGLLLALLAPALLVAAMGLFGGWIQVRWGGVSNQRSHAVLSLCFWGALGFVLLAFSLDGRRLSKQPLEKFSHLLDVLPAERGSWALMTGYDFFSMGAVTYLVDTESNLRKRLGPRSSFTNRPVFSGDGQRLFYWQCSHLTQKGSERREGDCHLYHLDLRGEDLRAEDLRPTTVPLAYSELSSHRMAFSYDGSQLALWRRQVVIVFEANGRELWRHRMPFDGLQAPGSIFFEDTGGLTLIRQRYRDATREESVTEVFRLDEDGLEKKFEAPLSEGEPHRTLGGRYLAATQQDGWRLRDFEGRVEHQIRKFFAWQFARLVNGRLASIVRDFETRSGEVVEIYDPPSEPGGQSQLSARVALKSPLFLGGQPAPDRLLIGGVERGMRRLHAGLRVPIFFRAPRTFVVDTRDASVIREISGLSPLPFTRAPGLQGSDWLLDAYGFPHRLDIETGEVEPVLKR